MRSRQHPPSARSRSDEAGRSPLTQKRAWGICALPSVEEQARSAVLAMGILDTPSLIIADEPTTALDVTTERRVLALLRSIRDEHSAALLIVPRHVGNPAHDWPGP
jgi:ABC-type lipoprotein export system ATPase subunit